MMPRYKKQRRYRRNRESFPIIPLAVLCALVLSQANMAVIAKWVAAIFGALLGLALLVVVVKLCIRRSNTRAHLVSSAKDIHTTDTLPQSNLPSEHYPLRRDCGIVENDQGNEAISGEYVIDLGDDSQFQLPASKAERRGAIGEGQLQFLLEKSLPIGGEDGYRIIHNLMMEDDSGTTTQVDFVVVSKYGIFVIEAKNYKGWIFANPASPRWTASYPNGKKFQFQNPVRQNFKHLCVISEKTGIARDLLIPIVAFGSTSDFKTDAPVGVMHFQDVPSFIRSFSTEKIKPSQLPEIVDVFREWNNAVAPALKLNHVKNILMRTGRSS